MGPIALPTRWKNDSGNIIDLTSLTQTELDTLGWFPVIPDTTIIDPNLTDVVSTSYSISGNTVIETIATRTLSISEVMIRKIDEIVDYSDALLEGTFVWNGHTIVGDSTSRQNITGLASAVANNVPLPAGFTWTDATGLPIPMTKTDVISLGATTMGWVDMIYKNAQKHAGAVQMLTSISAIVAYDYSTGWP